MYLIIRCKEANSQISIAFLKCLSIFLIVPASHICLLIPLQIVSVIFFAFLGTVPIPVQLGRISSFSLQLGNMEPLDLYENTGWKCQAPTPITIKIFVSNLNWE